MAQINFRIDDDTKRAAEALFKSLGLSMSSAITVFLNQSITERGIPFKIQIPDSSARPMSELLQRIDDVEHGRHCHYHDPRLVVPYCGKRESRRTDYLFLRRTLRVTSSTPPPASS